MAVNIAGGIVLNMLPFHTMNLDEGAGILTVGAGARWSEVIPYLDARGRSVAIMQSNDSFSVGGSISVNCHGWQLDRPPIIDSVGSFRLLTAGQEIRRCSRSENVELLALRVRRYGLSWRHPDLPVARQPARVIHPVQDRSSRATDTKLY